ncbi:hypothetical protein UlMin_013550 [Ulmus minor]
MTYPVVELFICVLSVFIISASFSTARFHPVDEYLVDCGSPSNTSVGNRVFISDTLALKYLSTPQDVIASTTLKSITSSDDSPIYQTARIFTKTSKYTFSIGHHGRHFIRLYFFPFVHASYDMTTANFSVLINNKVLLPKLNAQKSSLVKEFLVDVTSDSLVISFSPSYNSFAFLNAIEVMSAPDELITGRRITAYNPSEALIKGLLTPSLETIMRVNMGGPKVTYENDTLWRTWLPDESFLVLKNSASNSSKVGAVKYLPKYGITIETAPPIVYGTATSMKLSDASPNHFNVSWEFNVDPGFHYFVRFHFCDIVSVAHDMLYFNVYINSREVVANLDLDLSTAYYLDYVTDLLFSSKLRVSIGPSNLPHVSPNAILNGLEIMKINGNFSTLAPKNSDSSSKKNAGVIIGVSIGAFTLVLLAFIFFFICRNREKLLLGGRSKRTTSLYVSSYGNRIPFIKVQQATNNFDESCVIGSGGFGKVYKGALKDGTKVAVKRKNPDSQQGLTEFQTEIEMLSGFRHNHLVVLIGYCNENNEMILVYEYAENGTLRSHLYGHDLPSLSWEQRLRICIGAARGLHYLHTGFPKAIIHRDVKSANILVDGNFTAKVADFGLSKEGPEIDHSHVTTAVKGSFGYLDPEYFRRQHLTEKSDVYSFGALLFEVICGRPVVDSTLPTEMVGLSQWALKLKKEGKLEEIIDPSLVGKIRPNSLSMFGEIAEKCLADHGVDRPSMGNVLWNLECALQLQQGDHPEKSSNVSRTQLSSQELSRSCSSFSSFEMSKNVNDDDLSGVRMRKTLSEPAKSEAKWLLGDGKFDGLGFSL